MDEEQPLVKYVHYLANIYVRFDIFKMVKFLLVLRHSPYCWRRLRVGSEDEKLCIIEIVFCDEAKEVILDSKGVFRINIQICIH